MRRARLNGGVRSGRNSGNGMKWREARAGASAREKMDGVRRAGVGGIRSVEVEDGRRRGAERRKERGEQATSIVGYPHPGV